MLQCPRRALPVALVLLVLSVPVCAQITAITRGAADLVTPPDSTPAQVLAYGLGAPFQVAPNRAALFCNARIEGVALFDYENGTDVILFDDLAAIRAEKAVAVSRNERETGPDGKERIVLKFPIAGGFVPLGARRADGTPHPHAGTGFGLCQALSFPLDAQGHFGWGDKWVQRTEVHQFGYDGQRFTAVRSASGREQTHPIAGVWRISAPGLSNAIPEGDDLLFAVTAADDTGQATGVSRWSRVGGVWTPVGFSQVTQMNEGWAEPSLVRDRDGSLLFSARGSGGDRYGEVQVWRKSGDGPQWKLVVSTADVRVWHKQQDGPEWATIVKLEGIHEPGPISIGCAADATPYIAANQPGTGRQTLCLWPLNGERMDLEKALVARAAREEFGPAPGAGAAWMVDHPAGAVVRLADSKWHGVVAYRVLGNAEHQGAPPAPQSGCYVEEITSSGPVVPPWRFE